MSVRIVDVREVTKPIASPIRNAYIDFSKMTTSLVAVVTNVERNGHRVVGYGFNSNGRYGQGGLIRERFAPRLREADAATLLDATGENFDPDRIWSVMMANEKPGGPAGRSRSSCLSRGLIGLKVRLWRNLLRTANDSAGVRR